MGALLEPAQFLLWDSENLTVELNCRGIQSVVSHVFYETDNVQNFVTRHGRVYVYHGVCCPLLATSKML